MHADGTTPEDQDTGSGPNFISQDDDIFEEECESPARRTRSRTTARTIKQEVLMQVMDITKTKKAFSAKSAASRQFPPQFWAEYANAVLDAETGDLLEYRHLMKKPQY